ncbi:MAG: transglutaminase family protein [bacterium]|nr:transglutaminase family protein [bacterium]
MKKAILMVTLSLFPRLLVAQEVDLKSLAGEDWYGLYFNGQKSGYAMESTVVGEDNSVSLLEDAHFRVRMMGVRQDMRILSKRVYGPDGMLVSVESQVDEISGSQKFVGTVEGDELVLVRSMAGREDTQRLPRPKESIEDALKQVKLIGEDAKVGDSVSYSLFEPMLAKEVEATSTIVAVEERVLDGVATKVFRLKTSMPVLNIDTVSYITEDGTTLEDVVAGMITMRLEPKEIAQDVDYSNDVIVSNAAMVDRQIADPRGRASLKLRITGPLTSTHLYNDERQYLAAQGDAFAFEGRRVVLDGFEPAPLPIDNADVIEWSKPTLFVQSDDEKLVTKARELAGDEKDAFKVSETLCHWVFQNVRTTFSARMSNALEVMDSLEGDCTEHSILFVGLARAAGLPAREVAGLIYLEGGQGFYFHQWAKVWIGKWIDVDPTFDQPLADATHIKLGEGDLFEQAKLIPIIGQIRIEVVEETAAE